MNRLVLSLAAAALAMCQIAYADGYARNSNRPAQTGMPNARLTANTRSVLGGPAAESKTEAYDTAPVTEGYAINDRCGKDSSGCCDHVWDGYTPGCGLFGFLGRLQTTGCGTCDPCAGHGGSLFGRHHQGNCCGAANTCGGCAGGCFGNSFAGGAGSYCGSGPACGIGSRLHCFGANVCGGFMNSCRGIGLFHGPTMFSNCDDNCGCAGQGSKADPNQAKPDLDVPTPPPADMDADIDQVPPAPPAGEKSAARGRSYGLYPSSR